MTTGVGTKGSTPRALARWLVGAVGAVFCNQIRQSGKHDKDKSDAEVAGHTAPLNQRGRR